MVPRVAATVETVRPLFESAWPTSAALWLRNGGPRPGGLYANPVLADTYERVVREAEAAGGSRERRIEAARDAWYRGFVAEAIDRFCRDDGSARHLRPPPQGRADRRRHGRLARPRRGAARAATTAAATRC